MPMPRQTRETSQRAVDAVNAAICAGHRHPGAAVIEAAKALGLERATLQSQIKIAAQRYDIHVTAELPPPVLEFEPAERPRIRVKAPSTPSDAPIYRVLGIGDAHDGPSLPDKSRFKWLARHAAATRPDYTIQIGDFATIDSLSRHDMPGSVGQKMRPTYAADLESLEEALAVFYKEAAGLALHVTLGNHEARVKRFEDGSASLEGTLWQPLLDLFARYSWRTHEEGQFLFVGGVGFVHAPRTLMGREFGGKHLNAIANDAIFSIVFGHSHRGQIMHAPKIGPLSSVTILNLGTCMPTGYVADYAKVATTGWTYGVYDLTIQAGRIVGHSFISMDELERRYS